MAFSRDPDYYEKISLVGDADVGLSALLLRFTQDTFSISKYYQLGLPIYRKTKTVDDLVVSMNLHDYGNQSLDKFIACEFSPVGTDVFIVAFDLTNEISFQNTQSYIEEIQRKYSKAKILLIGTKADCISKITVTESDASEVVHNHRLSGYISCSAKENVNIQRLFDTAARLKIKAIKFQEETSIKSKRGPDEAKITKMNAIYEKLVQQVSDLSQRGIMDGGKNEKVNFLADVKRHLGIKEIDSLKEAVLHVLKTKSDESLVNLTSGFFSNINSWLKDVLGMSINFEALKKIRDRELDTDGEPTYSAGTVTFQAM